MLRYKNYIIALLISLPSLLLGQELTTDSIKVDSVNRLEIAGPVPARVDTIKIDSNHTQTLILSEESIDPSTLDSLKEEPIDFVDGRVIDFAPDYPDSIIAARLATVESELPLRTNDRIRSFIDYFSIRNRDYTRKMMRRSAIYFPIMEEILAKNNMPDAIKYLSIVESGLDPKIRSWAGAMGLWQFMPATGSIYKLDYDFYIDERLDPYKSTEAACKYLKQLYRMFGDWELALGAYNCGPGNMRKAIRKSGGKRTFEEIYKYLPRETRSYVPQFMAVNYVMRFTDEHNLFIEDWEEEALPEYKTITLDQYTDLNRIYEYSNVCLDDIVKLNPEIKRNAIGKEWKSYELKLPIEFFNLGSDSIKVILDSAAVEGKEQLNYSYSNPNSRDLVGNKTVKTTHRVRSGENLGRIANRYGVRVSEIKSWNRMRKNTIYPGQRLAIYTKGTSSKTTKKSSSSTTSAAKNKNTEKTPVPKGEKVIYIVKPGDVVGSIAEKHEVSASNLRKWNGIKRNLIKVGQKLVIYGSKDATNTKSVTLSNEKKTTKVSKATTKYIVKSGDALYNIAMEHGISVNELKSINGLTSNNINPGQQLLIPATTKKASIVESKNKAEVLISENGKYHIVKEGDSLWSISKSYDGVTVNKLKELNNLTSNDLKIGQKLKLG